MTLVGMPPRFHKDELSASHAIRRLLDLGITRTNEILYVLECGRCGAWPRLLEFFERRKITWPSNMTWADPSPNLVRVVRQKWLAGYKPTPRRARGSAPLPKPNRGGRPKVSKSDRIRALIGHGQTNAEIVEALGVSAAFVRVIRHRLARK